MGFILNLNLKCRPVNWILTPERRETITVSRKHRTDKILNLVMNETPIQGKNSHKHLGITLQNDCFWKNHIEDIVAKVRPMLNYLRILRSLKYRQGKTRKQCLMQCRYLTAVVIFGTIVQMNMLIFWWDYTLIDFVLYAKPFAELAMRSDTLKLIYTDTYI